MLTLLSCIVPTVTDKIRRIGIFRAADQRMLSRKYDGFGIPLEKSKTKPTVIGIPNSSRETPEEFAYAFLADLSDEDLKKYYDDVSSQRYIPNLLRRNQYPYGKNQSETEDIDTDSVDPVSTCNNAFVTNTCSELLERTPILKQYNTILKNMRMPYWERMPDELAPIADPKVESDKRATVADSIWNYDLGFNESIEDDFDID